MGSPATVTTVTQRGRRVLRPRHESPLLDADDTPDSDEYYSDSDGNIRRHSSRLRRKRTLSSSRQSTRSRAKRVARSAEDDGDVQDGDEENEEEGEGGSEGDEDDAHSVHGETDGEVAVDVPMLNQDM